MSTRGESRRCEREAAEGRSSGRSRAGRLSRLDAIVLHREAELLRRSDGAFAGAAYIDVGVGDAPHTTLESAKRCVFRAILPPASGR